MKNPSITKVLSLAHNAGCFNYEGKELFRKEAMSLLRRIVKDLNLQKGTYTIHFNPAGPAVSGDAILHHDNFHIWFSDFGGTFRECKSQKDYIGGRNQKINKGYWREETMTYDELLGHLKFIVEFAKGNPSYGIVGK